MDYFTRLPQECIAQIVSLTTPRDACRAALVSHSFQAASDSDATWEAFLPSDCEEIVSNSASPALLSTHHLSKKQLFFRLCDYPILVNNGTMSFALERESGKKCYMMGARNLLICWGDTPRYWEWKHLPESRFEKVAELKLVWWLDVKGKIEARILSPKTTYTADLIFKLKQGRYGFRKRTQELRVYFEGREQGGERRNVVLDPSPDMPQLSQQREDGWMEIEMGSFFNENGDDGTLVCSLWETDNFASKGGLIIQGIELRPKHTY